MEQVQRSSAFVNSQKTFASKSKRQTIFRMCQLKREIRLDRNDGRMIRSMGSIRPEDKISAEEFRAELKLNSMGEDYNGLII